MRSILSLTLISMLAPALPAASIGDLDIPDISATTPTEKDHWLKKHQHFCELGLTQAVDLLFIGDSITEQWLWGSQIDVWKNAFGAYNPANMGIGGDRTEHILWRIENGTLDHVKPKLVVLLIGHNNLWRDSDEAIIAGIEACAKSIKTHLPESQLLVLGLLPSNQSADAPVRARKDTINAKIAQLADYEGIQYEDIGGHFLEPDGSLIDAAYKADQLHLTDEGYRIWAQAMMPLLSTLLKPNPTQTMHPILEVSTINPRYWAFNGNTAPLLGGSSEDNLFQIKGLEAELDLIASVGGNVIRNTMSDRDEGDLRAFKEVAPGRYDLTQWNPAYWEKLDTLLRETARRNIAVQFEIWDRFDHSRNEWQTDPWNPANNVNYSFEDSGFDADYPAHPAANFQPFFKTVPAMEDNTLVLPYQQAFVRKLLQHTLPYSHVLYCMDNETSAAPEWGAYWAKFIRAEADAAGKRVYLTEMWDQWDVTADIHRETTDRPERYDFVDISQNTQMTGQANWDNAQVIWQRLAALPRPINSTKIYGNDDHKSYANSGKGHNHAISTFWRNILGGFASSRFHRPDHGLAIGEVAQYQIRTARLFLSEYNIIEGQPDSTLEALKDRDDDEAYLHCIPGKAAAVLFPISGSVILDRASTSQLAESTLSLRWLQLAPEVSAEKPTFSAAVSLPAQDQTTLSTPEGPGPWLAVLTQ